MVDLLKWIWSQRPSERRRARDERRWAEHLEARRRRFAEEELMAEYGAGTWVDSERMLPATNVQDRLYRTEKGNVRRYHDFTQHVEREKIVAWYFPE